MTATMAANHGEEECVVVVFGRAFRCLLTRSTTWMGPGSAEDVTAFGDSERRLMSRNSGIAGMRMTCEYVVLSEAPLPTEVARSLMESVDTAIVDARRAIALDGKIGRD